MQIASWSMRFPGVVTVCLAMTFAIGPHPAEAAPPSDPGQTSCVFTLSKPFVVDVSGVKMVSATLKPLLCTGDILPNSQTVCVELSGSGNPSQCSYKAGYETAQVYFAPYRPGSTYISTGSGCGAVGPSFVSVCETQGPLSTTL